MNITYKELEEMKAVNILEVDKSQLVDLRAIEIDKSLPKMERVLDYISQINNPYCYKIGKVVVKVRFSNEKKTMEECLKDYFLSL